MKSVNYLDGFFVRAGLSDFVFLANLQIMQKQEIFNFEVKIGEKRLEIALNFSKVFNNEVCVSDDVLSVYFGRVTVCQMLELVDVDAQLFLNILSHTAWIL